MGIRGVLRALLVATALALVVTGGATAAGRRTGHRSEPGSEPRRGHPAGQGGGDRAAAERRSVRHQLQRPLSRQNANGSVTVQRLRRRDADLLRSRLPATSSGATIEDRETWWDRIVERQADIDGREAGATRPLSASCPSARGGASIQSHEDEIVVLRVDYFENYAGRFLSVEAKTRLATLTGTTYDRADAVAVLEHRAPARRSTRRRGR